MYSFKKNWMSFSVRILEKSQTARYLVKCVTRAVTLFVLVAAAATLDKQENILHISLIINQGNSLAHSRAVEFFGIKNC